MSWMASTALLILTGLSPTPSVKDVLAQKYKQFNATIVKRDQPAASAWLKANCADKFVFTSFQKTRLSRTGYIAEIEQEIRVTEKVLLSTMTVRSVEQHGDEYTAVVAVEFKGRVTIDSRKMTLSSPFVSKDTWKKVGKDWKLTKSVQVNSDTQVEPSEG